MSLTVTRLVYCLLALPLLSCHLCVPFSTGVLVVELCFIVPSSSAVSVDLVPLQSVFCADSNPCFALLVSCSPPLLPSSACDIALATVGIHENCACTVIGIAMECPLHVVHHGHTSCASYRSITNPCTLKLPLMIATSFTSHERLSRHCRRLHRVAIYASAL